MKPGVYIETSVPSYYFETRPGAGDNTMRTREWWDKERSAYEVFTSELVLAELSKAPEPKRSQCLDLLSSIPVLEIEPEIGRLAEVYIGEKLFPQDPPADALHVAIATIYKIDYLLTWNCRHLANENKRIHLLTVNSRLGYPSPVLCTPLTLRLVTEDGFDEE